METEDLTPAMQEIMARMSRMQTELTDLKTRAKVLSIVNPVQPLNAEITTTRRKTLQRLGLALLGGAATAATLGSTPSAEAKVSAHPSANGMANKVGMLVLPPGAPSPTGSFSSTVSYGLIACADKTNALDTTSLGFTPIGLTGIGSGNALTGIGVQGMGNIGVSGSGSNVGVSANGDNYGVYANNSDTGVYGSGYINGGNFKGGDVGFGVGAAAGGGFIYQGIPSNTSVGIVATSGNALDLIGKIANNQNIGLYATAGTSLGRNPTAAYFDGRVAVNGALSKASGTFKIDHPLDPENKYLYHSFVESPDMLNIYTGIATLDAEGTATVKMPDWFEALNRDFRYQLTSIGMAGPNLYISQKITELKFKIAGGQPDQEVSWMVTGIRQDEWAKAHPIQVEEDKTGDARGKFLHPEVFGKPNALRVSLQ